MISICNVCGKTYHNSSQHYCIGSNVIQSSGGFTSYVLKPSPYEIEVRARVINNLNKLRSLSENCNHTVPAVSGIVAELQADINIIWGWVMPRTFCSICHKSFKPEDFSTYYMTEIDPVERLAHDECLEILCFRLKHLVPPIKVVEFGHKIWGDDD
jgi:hypothetical protein